jgi:hypothetical protein
MQEYIYNYFSPHLERNSKFKIFIGGKSAISRTIIVQKQERYIFL